MNEFFELLEDEDLNGSVPVQGWIWYCQSCRALFGSKAISNRTIFPWWGYHPADGNCKVTTEDTQCRIEARAYRCTCKASPMRVLSRDHLISLIKSHKQGERHD